MYHWQAALSCMKSILLCSIDEVTSLSGLIITVPKCYSNIYAWGQHMHKWQPHIVTMSTGVNPSNT